MAALGWLLNLGFAGGGVPVIITPSAEDLKVLTGTLMSSFLKLKRFKKRKPFISNMVYKRLFNIDSISKPKYIKYDHTKLIDVLSDKIVPITLKTTKQPQEVKLFDGQIFDIKTRNKKSNFNNQLDELIKFRTSKRNKKKSINYFEVNSRHKKVKLND